MHPCLNCPHRIGDNFCKFLPWNDTTLPTPLDKYIAWQGVPCPHIDDPQQLPLPLPKKEAGQDSGQATTWPGSQDNSEDTPG